MGRARFITVVRLLVPTSPPRGSGRLLSTRRNSAPPLPFRLMPGRRTRDAPVNAPLARCASSRARQGAQGRPGARRRQRAAAAKAATPHRAGPKKAYIWRASGALFRVHGARPQSAPASQPPTRRRQPPGLASPGARRPRSSSSPPAAGANALTWRSRTLGRTSAAFWRQCSCDARREPR